MSSNAIHSAVLDGVSPGAGGDCADPSLAGLECFRGYETDDLSAVLGAASARQVQARQVLYRRGDPCTAVFAVARGAFKLIRPGRNGHERVMEIVAPGALLGACSLCSATGYSTTAVALRDSEVLAIGAMAFARELRTRPRVASSLLAAMSGRIEGLLGRIERHCGMGSEQRVAEFLLNACDRLDGVLDACGRRDLASYLGLRPETLSRILGAMKRRRHIEVVRGRLRVLDRAGLEQWLHPGR